MNIPTHHQLSRLLRDHQHLMHPMIPEMDAKNVKKLDLSPENPALRKIDLKDTSALHHYIFDEILQGKIGMGGYGENRIIYTRSAHYAGEELRSLHLGVDLWAVAGTPIWSPLDGYVHSWADNLGFGNYGPTIILAHELAGYIFYTLYGHLAPESLEGLYPEKPVKSGDLLAKIGQAPGNGDWPPHLHLQLIRDMAGAKGDFPGVARPSEKEKYLDLCPDPMLLLPGINRK